MRIDKLSIERFAPFQNLSAKFHQVNVILGDNERGKSRFLGLIAEALFAKAPQTVSFEGRPFSARTDAPRLRRILTLTHGPLPEDWNAELRSLIQGKDEISPRLQKDFLPSLGVGSWLDTLAQQVRALKEAVDGALPSAERLKAEEFIQQKHRADEGEVFPLMVKTRLVKEYLELMEDYQEIQNRLAEARRGDTAAQSREALNRKIQSLENQIRQRRRLFENRSKPPTDFSVGGVLPFIGGVLALGAAFLAVWYGLRYPRLHPVNLGGVALFAAGSFLLLKTLWGELQGKERAAFHREQAFFRRADKENNRLAALETELYNLRSGYKEEMEALRRRPAPENAAALEAEGGRIFAALKEKEPKIIELFNTSKPSALAEALSANEAALQNADLLGFYRQSEAPKSPSGSDYLGEVKACLGTVKELLKNPLIGGRYAEVGNWTWQSGDLQTLGEEAEMLLDKLARDRSLGEKLAKSYRHWQEGGEEFLFRVFADEAFRQLVPYVFGGKYKTFDLSLGDDNRFRIHARTGADELIPIEDLSPSATLQFYFALKLALAKFSLGEEAGILLLDEAFASFDTPRTRLFIDIIEALVKEGWQVFYALKDDKLVWDALRQRFPDLKLINLNKENAA